MSKNEIRQGSKDSYKRYDRSSCHGRGFIFDLQYFHLMFIFLRNCSTLTTDVNGDRMGIVKCEGKVREDL